MTFDFQTFDLKRTHIKVEHYIKFIKQWTEQTKLCKHRPHCILWTYPSTCSTAGNFKKLLQPWEFIFCVTEQLPRNLAFIVEVFSFNSKEMKPFLSPDPMQVMAKHLQLRLKWIANGTPSSNKVHQNYVKSYYKH